MVRYAFTTMIAACVVAIAATARFFEPPLANVARYLRHAWDIAFPMPLVDVADQPTGEPAQVIGLHETRQFLGRRAQRAGRHSNVVVGAVGAGLAFAA